MARTVSSVRGLVRLSLPVAALSVLFAAAPLAAQANDGPPRANGPGLLHGQYRPGHIWMGGAFIPNPNAAPAGARLTYFGGRVISNAQVVLVVYGSGSFLPQVTSAGSPSMSSFFQQVLNSALRRLADGVQHARLGGGTNQTIGRGSFLAQSRSRHRPPTTAPPSATPRSRRSSSRRSAPAIFRPPRATRPATPTPFTWSISRTERSSRREVRAPASSGGFCAYHGTVGSGPFGEFYYGVFPDMQAGSGLRHRLRRRDAAFGNYTSVASHELVEAITDPEVGLATALGPPLAWYDNTNGEIGDICNAQQGTIVGGDGVDLHRPEGVLQHRQRLHRLARAGGQRLLPLAEPERPFGLSRALPALRL